MPSSKLRAPPLRRGIQVPSTRAAFSSMGGNPVELACFSRDFPAKIFGNARGLGAIIQALCAASQERDAST